MNLCGALIAGVELGKTPEIHRQVDFFGVFGPGGWLLDQLLTACTLQQQCTHCRPIAMLDEDQYWMGVVLLEKTGSPSHPLSLGGV